MYEVVGNVLSIESFNFAYPACKNCFKKTSKDSSSGRWICSYCFEQFSGPRLRYKLLLSVQLHSGQTFKVCAFGKQLEKVFGASVEDFKRAVDALPFPDFKKAMTQSLVGQSFHLTFKSEQFVKQISSKSSCEQPSNHDNDVICERMAPLSDIFRPVYQHLVKLKTPFYSTLRHDDLNFSDAALSTGDVPADKVESKSWKLGSYFLNSSSDQSSIRSDASLSETICQPGLSFPTGSILTKMMCGQTPLLDIVSSNVPRSTGNDISGDLSITPPVILTNNMLSTQSGHLADHELSVVDDKTLVSSDESFLVEPTLIAHTAKSNQSTENLSYLNDTMVKCNSPKHLNDTMVKCNSPTHVNDSILEYNSPKHVSFKQYDCSVVEKSSFEYEDCEGLLSEQQPLSIQSTELPPLHNSEPSKESFLLHNARQSKELSLLYNSKHSKDLSPLSLSSLTPQFCQSSPIACANGISSFSTLDSSLMCNFVTPQITVTDCPNVPSLQENKTIHKSVSCEDGFANCSSLGLDSSLMHAFITPKVSIVESSLVSSLQENRTVSKRPLQENRTVSKRPLQENRTVSKRPLQENRTVYKCSLLSENSRPTRTKNLFKFIEKKLSPKYCSSTPISLRKHGHFGKRKLSGLSMMEQRLVSRLPKNHDVLGNLGNRSPCSVLMEETSMVLPSPILVPPDKEGS